MSLRTCPSAGALALALALGVVAMGVSAPAAAEPVAKKEVERARKAYEDGAAAYKLGSFAEAAARFEEAYRIMQFPTMLFDVAQSYRRLGESQGRVQDLKKALELDRAFLRDAAPGANHRQVAEKLVPTLEKTIAAQTRRLREGLIERAAGKEGLFLADQLLSEGATADALVVVDRILIGPKNPRAVILGALVRRGVCAGNLGRRELAVDAFRRALSLDPGLPVPDGAGAASEGAFAEARRLATGQKALALLHVPPGAVPRGEAAPVPVSVEFDATEMVAALALYYRPAGRGAYSTVRGPRDTRQLAVPAAFLQNLRGGASVEYYVIALDARDGELVTAGSAAEPFVFQVAPSPVETRDTTGPAWYRRWWVWGIAGTLAGGAAGGAYLLTREAPYNPTPVTIPTR
jgi:tetratricopeptide (TPR) repeat protein